jgi:hypothetical protein
MKGKPISAASTKVPSEMRGTRLSGGALPSFTHSSSATSSARIAGWFVGQTMKATGGKANPAAVNALLKAKLGIE